MSLLYRKARRDLVGLGIRGLVVTASLAVGVAMYIGGLSGRDSLFHTRDDYFDRLHLSDAQLFLSPPADQSELPDLGKIPGVKAWSKRFVELGSVERDGKPLSVAVVHIDPAVNPPVNTLELLEGRMLNPERTDEILIEKTLRDFVGYKLGDKITLNPWMNPDTVTVVGVVISPEFLLPTANPDVMLPSKGSLGVVFRSEQKYTELFGEPWYNDLAFLAADGVTREELVTRLKAAMAPVKEVTIERETLRDQHFGYRFLQEDLKGFGIFIQVVVGLFAVVTAIVLLMSINRLIVSQEREIGALIAQGFKFRHIAGSVLYMALLIALGGVVFGILGAPVIRDLLAGSYANNVGLPPPLMIVPTHLVVEAACGAIVLTAFFSLIPVLQVSRWQPSQLMRGATQERFIPPGALAGRILDLVAGDSGTRRHAVRNLMRRPRLTFAVVLLIAMSVGLATALRIGQEAWVHYAKTTFAKETWDAIISFRVPLDPADVEPITHTQGVTNPRPLVLGTGMLIQGDWKRQYRFVGLVTDKPTRAFNFVDGGHFSNHDAAEIVLSCNFAGGHKFRAGDKVVLENARGKKFDATIAGVSNDMTMSIAYMPEGFARKVTERGAQTNGLMLDFNAEPHLVKAELFKHEMVQYVSLKADMETTTWEFLKVMYAITTVALLVAVLLGITFMLTGLSLTVLEREGEYASVRALGFSDRRVGAIIMWEVVMQGAMAAVLAAPLIYVLSLYLQYAYAQAWLYIDFIYDPVIILGTTLPIFLFLPIAALPGIRHILKVNLAQSLRARAFG